MSVRLIPFSLATLIAVFGHSVSAQNDEAVSRIVEQFNAIENGLGDMNRISLDATHADGDYALGQVDVWLDHGEVTKVRNEHRDDLNVNIQEYWVAGNRPIFVYEKSEWHGNEDGTVNLNEYRYYLHDGRAIREMSRSAIRQKGQSLDLSDVSHQVNDEIDAEYGRSLFEDKDNQILGILRVANAFSSNPVGAANLASLPYRLLLQTISPDGRRCFAWGIAGLAQPAWSRWEREGYEYLQSLGEPVYTVHLVDLADFRSIGQIQTEFDPSGMPYFWAKWSDDGVLAVTGCDYRWATDSALVHKVEGGGVTQVADLGAALSRLSIQLLRERDHPYAIDAEEAFGFVDVESLESSGRMAIRYAIESKFEGPRRNAHLDFDLQLDGSTGEVSQISGEILDYDPVPTTWSMMTSFLPQAAAEWLSSPPQLEDYLQVETFLDDGIRHLYNRFGKSIHQDFIEILIRRPLFTESPHYPGGVVLDSRFEFGHYDPESVRLVTAGMVSVLDPMLVAATRPLYDAEFRSMAHHFQEALRYWNENPVELERQKVAYLAKIRDQTLPEFYYLLEGNLAEQLMENYSQDWTERTCYLTALRFWMRRSCDGSYDEFANLLQHTIAAYEPDYFSQRGIPALRSSGSPAPVAAKTQVLMNESGALGIDHLTPFSATDLQGALPDFDVREKDFFDEGGQHPAFGVSRDGTEVLTLIRFDSGDPFAFEIRSENISLESGVTTGQTFREIFRDQRPLGFFDGLETDIGAVVAEAPSSERITLYFQPPAGAGDDAWRPGLSFAELADFVLTEVRWTP